MRPPRSPNCSERHSPPDWGREAEERKKLREQKRYIHRAKIGHRLSFRKEYVDAKANEYRGKDYLQTFAALVTEADKAIFRQAKVNADPQPTLEQRFREQSDKWHRETQHFSSPGQRTIHPSYLAIMGMGNDNPREIIKLMLRDMQQNRRPWFLALSYLAKDNPVRQSDAGKTDKMIKAWVNWGKANRLL
jgi:hypothetical protein